MRTIEGAIKRIETTCNNLENGFNEFLAKFPLARIVLGILISFLGVVVAWGILELFKEQWQYQPDPTDDGSIGTFFLLIFCMTLLCICGGFALFVEGVRDIRKGIRIP